MAVRPVLAPAGPVPAGLLFAVGLVAAAVAFELVRPVSAGPVGFDSAASVIHFDRIVAGRTLEAFVTATPKPLLSFVYGPLQAVASDWRPISWATIGAYAVAVALAFGLAWRTAGVVAAAFVAGALLASAPLLADVSIAYAVPWALVGWLVAALAMTAERPRPVVAGLALALASLARLETLVVVGVAAIVVGLAWLAPRLGRTGRAAPVPADRSWLVPVLGALALPVMLAHDWLLTGDPLFWLSVSARYSEAAPASVQTPAELLGSMAAHYAAMALLTVLAVLGLAWLVRRRRWVLAIGAIALGPGIAVFLVILAARGTYVSPRYLAAIDVAVALTAAAGAAALAEAIGPRLPTAASTATGRRATVLAAVAALVVAGLASWLPPSIDASFRSSARAPRLQAERDDRVVPVLDCALDAIPGSHDVPADPDPTSADQSEAILLVPGLQRPRLAVDLDVSLDRIHGTPASWAAPGPGFLPFGRLIYHDRVGDRPTDAYTALEVDAPTAIGSVTLVPLLVDRDAGIWVLRIDRSGGAVGGPPCDVDPGP
jgi:hypothetical protein